MRKITHEMLQKHVAPQVFDSGRSLFLWGGTGIGKSQGMMSFSKDRAEQKGLEFTTERGNYSEDTFGYLDVRLSQFAPEDIKGIPDISGNRTVWKIPDWYPETGHGLLFFDEMNLATPVIQAAAYQIILDRMLDKFPLPDGWACFAAGNRIEDRANVYEMAAPLRNRFIHYELTSPHPEAWIDWALAKGIDTRIISFIKTKPNFLNISEQSKDQQAFATPRSWEMLSDVLAHVPASDKLGEELYYNIIQAHGTGCVSSAVAADFVMFLKFIQDLPVDDILNDPASYDLEDMRSDKLYALSSALYTRFKPTEHHAKKFINVCRYVPQEYGVLMVRMVAKERKNRHALMKAAMDVSSQDFMERYAKLFGGGT